MTVKILVQQQGSAPKEFELTREQPLKANMLQICKMLFNLPCKSSYEAEYILVQMPHQRVLTEDDLNSADFPIPVNCLFQLRPNPSFLVESAMKLLQTSELASKKKALFDLQTNLKDEMFARKFFEKGGVAAVTSHLQDRELPASALSYALAALHGAMSYNFKWDDGLPNNFLQLMVSFAEATNPGVVKNALKILCRLAEHNRYGFTAINQTVRTNAQSANRPPFSILIQSLSSTELDIQVGALTLINVLFGRAGPTDRSTLLQTLESQDIHSALKKNLNSTDAEFRRQLYFFQKFKLGEIRARKDVRYDSNLPEHEALLMRLWTATYPDTKLESRRGDQWKLLGFQGQDPATDFRGMGILGLDNLLYFAENHTDTFRKILNLQLTRKEREYPVATAGINLSQMVFDLLRTQEDVSDVPEKQIVFPVFFSHKHAFEEIYCTTFEALDKLWDEMQAAYMDFRKVSEAVRKQVSDVIENMRPLTLDQFSFSVLNKQDLPPPDDNGEEPESVKKLRAQVQKEVLDLVKQQKLAFLSDGATFKLTKSVQIQNRKIAQYFYAKLADNHQDLHYSSPLETIDKPNSLPNVAKTSEMIDVVLGLEVPSYSKRKATDEITALSFAVTFKDEKVPALEFLACSRDDFVNWTDGLRALLGKPFKCVETLEEYKNLVTLDMKVRLLDLEGSDIPKDPPPIPEPPPDFDFVELRAKTTK